MRSLLLAFFALLGLFGQGVAWGNALPTAASEPHASRMMAGCDEVMPRAPTPGKLPCGGSVECMMAMGCLLPMLPHDLQTAEADRMYDPAQQFWPDIAVLVGANLEPELDPPAYLA